MIALLQPGHARSGLDHQPGALMAHDRGEQPFRIGAGEGELVGMADAGGLHLNHHLARFRAVELNRFYGQRLARLVCNRCLDIHDASFPDLPL